MQESKSSSSSSTASYDQRVAADNGAIAIGAGGAYTQNFPQQAVDLITHVLDFSSGVLQGGARLSEQALMAQAQTANKTIDSANSIAQNAQVGTSSFFTANAVWIIGAAVAGLYILRKRR